MKGDVVSFLFISLPWVLVLTRELGLLIVPEPKRLEDILRTGALVSLSFCFFGAEVLEVPLIAKNKGLFASLEFLGFGFKAEEDLETLEELGFEIRVNNEFGSGFLVAFLVD